MKWNGDDVWALVMCVLLIVLLCVGFYVGVDPQEETPTYENDPKAFCEYWYSHMPSKNVPARCVKYFISE